MWKETKITQAKKASKQHGSLTHSKSKTNQSIHKKMKCIFPIPVNNIYRKEQEVSSKEKNVNSNARNINSLWMQREYNNQSDWKKYTSFSSKSKPKTHKNKNTNSGTGPTWHCAGGSWQSGSGRAPLLANKVQAVAPLMANRVQALAPLVANITCAVPWINPKHKENENSS